MADQANQNSPVLEGIRVVEVATYIFAPGAATVLSDFGAEVIKVEPPGTGDPYRFLYQVPPMPAAEMNYCWLLDARNKKSIAIDLKQPRGRDVLLRLIEGADVMITNFQPAVLERLKISYDDLRPTNPRLVYAQVTGYGLAGDEVAKPGYDMTAFWGRSGLMDAVSNADSEPCLSLAGMGDHPSAMALFGGIMMALYQRERTGQGTRVNSSLIANGAWANSCLIQAALCGAERYRQRTRMTAVNALINHYVTRDGRRFIMCSIDGDRYWPRLCRAIERTDLIDDPRFADKTGRAQNAEELIVIIDAAIRQRDWEYWHAALTVHDLVFSPVPAIHEVPDDPQMQAAGVFVEMDHPRHGRLRTVNSPVSLDGVPKPPPRPAPEVGEHSAEVLEELGFDPAEIGELFAAGVVSGGKQPGVAT